MVLGAIACSGPRQSPAPAALELALTDTDQPDQLPASTTCVGGNRSPGLRWGPVPDSALSGAILVSSSDGRLHWLAWDFDPRQPLSPGIHATDVPPLQARSSWGTHGWHGPCAPAGPAAPLPSPAPPVTVQVWLLDRALDAPPTLGPAELLARIEPLVVAAGSLTLTVEPPRAL